MGGDFQIMTTPEVYSAPPRDITSGKHITLSGERKLGSISNCFDVKSDLKTVWQFYTLNMSKLVTC